MEGRVVSLSTIRNLLECYSRFPKPTCVLKYAPNASFSKRISLWKGDITTLKVDAVVNAANESLLGGGGIDGAIHRAAGQELLKVCQKLGGCLTGDAKITKGYNLPASYVIHTVGPIGEKPEYLESCYKRVMDVVQANNLASVAFCCVSTGVYGYDNERAAHVALRTVRGWMDKHHEDVEKIQRIIFCTFLNKDQEIYERLLPEYFPEPASEAA